ncbi:MAG TPA: 3-dehydroquinate synthase [Allosphingosinicella sp.]
MSGGHPTDVVLGERSYKVLVEEDCFSRAGAVLAPFARDGRIVVVTDRDVFAAQGSRFAAGLERGGLTADGILIEPGEAAKDWSHLARLVEDLLARGVERGDHVVALGGGVIGDLVGFAAAILKRGCGIIQVPTTLLAMVDAAIGGKTGINVAAGKNLVGAFHQPSLVLVDPVCLDTLPDRQLRAGYAEVVKYGLIGDAPFFAWCEEHGASLLAGDPAARLHAIRTCVAAKAEIVAQDERETIGRRALLNLGHSFAHALEAETGFSDRLLHGEAVAVGLALAFRLSAARGLCAPEDAARVIVHLRRVGLPTSLGEAGIAADGAALAGHMRHDKKAAGGLRLILARGIGDAFVDASVTFEEVAAFLDAERG